jgi:outer membrane protein OmpA-like peptidoglycan-associated protein
MCKTLTTIGCLIVGASLLGWYDRWHLVIGLPLLVGGMLACMWLRKRLRLEDEENTDEIPDDTDGSGRQVILGVLHGGVAVLLLTAAFAIAAWTDMAGSLREPDCSVPLREIGILTEGQAYARIIEIVEAQLQPSMGASCRQALREHKVRALLALADQSQGPERLDKLQQAWEEAERIPHYDLVQVIAAREQAETRHQVIEEQQRVIQDREARLRNLEKYRLSMQETARGTMVRLTDERLVLFDSGQAALTPSALEPLKDIAALLNLR